MDRDTMKIVYGVIEQRISLLEGALRVGEQKRGMARINASKLKAFRKLKWRLQYIEKESRRLR